MKKFTYILAALTSGFLFSSTSFAQSIADVVKQEKQKHLNKGTESKVYTNDDLSRFKYTGAITTARPLPESAADKEKGTTDKQKDASDKEVKGSETSSKEASKAESSKKPENETASAQSEEYWRRAIREARDKAQALENKGAVLQLQLNDLSNKFYREQDVIAREQMQKDMQKTMFEIDQNKTQVESAKRAVEDLENEARKAGVPPGWLR